MDHLSDALDILKRKGWYATIAPRFQNALAAEARLLHVKAGQSMGHYGDSANGLFGIVDGSVLLSFPREDGILLPMAPLGSGFWVGDLSVLSGQAGLMSMSSRTDVVAVNIPTHRTLELVRKMPELYSAFYQLTRININLALRLLAALTADTAQTKIAMRLLILSEYLPHEKAWLPVSNNELAIQLGLSLPTVQRTIKKLEAVGAIESGYSKIRIIDRKAIINDS